MPTLDWTCEQTDGVTLVELQIRGESGQQVRVESTLDPVWPPRREGQPTTGWDGTTFEGELEDGSLAVGYASPADPSEPPAELRPVTAEEETIDPGDVVRALGAGTPPRDAVPREPAGTSTGQADTTPPAERTSGEPTPQSEDTGEQPPTLPPAVESYFTAVEQRLAAAAQLSEAETVEQARDAVAAAGGMSAVDGLDEQLRADRARLESLGQRQRALTEELARTDIPVAHLERLA